MIKRYYAGIGAKKTPESICKVMTLIAQRLEKLQFILRSGGAYGADSAFERGVKDINNKEIFYAQDILSNRYGTSDKAIDILSNTHPAFDRICNDRYKTALLARDGYQVLGPTLDNPVKFIVCWTPKGEIVGGTGQALRLAQIHKIKVYNLAIDSDINKLDILLENLESIVN